MKNIYLFAAFLLYFALANNVSAQTVTIGAGAQNGTSSNGATGDPGPIYKSTGSSSFIYSRYHYLYTTSELATAGLPPGSIITGLAWYLDNNAGMNTNFQMEIWLENSGLTTVQTPPQTWAALTTTATQVYNSNSTFFGPTNGWLQFNTSSFVYTGGALEISVSSDMSQGSSPWTTAGFSWKKDPITGRTISYCGSSPNTTLSNARTVRPQLRITYIPGTPCSGQPTAGTVTGPAAQVCPLAPFGVSLTGTTLASGINIQWQSRPGTSGAWSNITGATNAAETFTASVTSQYRAYVVCNASSLADTSLPVTVNVASLFPGGNYTIDAGSPASATNFQSFTDAVNAMACGIAGPIVFDVVTGSGPYNEQIVINDIPTTSAVNTVTFNGHGETLTYSSSNTNDRAGIKLDGADHIIIRNLVVEPTGTYGFGIQLINDADSNVIDSCTINNTLSSTSSNYAGIVVSGSHTSATTNTSDCDGIIISNNTVNGGYYGITNLGGSSATTRTSGNTIINNTVANFYAYGIYVYGNDGIIVGSNDVGRPTRTSVTTFYGIMMAANSINALVSQNRIHDPMGGAPTSTSANYGIYFSGCDATSGNENTVANNLITFENGNGTQYAFYNSSSNYVRYYHNTVSLENTASTSGATRGLYQTTTASGIEFKNNIISITRGGSTAKYGIYKNTAGSSIASDNNVFHIASANASTNNIGYQSGAQTTLASWQSATSGDANSVAANPQFAAPATGDYKPTNTAVDNIGQPITAVSYDILGYPRSATTPDPGAFEMVVPCATPSNVVASGIIYTGATINWTPVPGAAGYEYDLSTNATPPLSGTPYTTTTYSTTSLNSNTTYYFHVRTECSPGAFSPWTTISFSTPVIPPCIPALPTVTNITLNSADVNWAAITGAVGYEYDVSSSPTPPASGTFTTGTSHSATGLASGTMYYVHVRTDCDSGLYSVWVTTTFSTQYPPCQPPVVNISDITTGSADIDWPPIATAVEYEYAVTGNPTPPASGGIITSTTSHTVGGLNDDQQYYVHIRTNCGPGGVSAWVTTPFTTLAYCIAPTAIISNVTASSADINWNARSGANSYEYALSTSIQPPATGTGTTGLNYNANQLNPGTKYYIHLRSVCYNNELSNWSTSGFTTEYPTSVANAGQSEGIEVYPNPVTDVLKVTIDSKMADDKGTIVIRDITGKEVKNIPVKTGQISIDVSSLVHGVYMLHYTNGTYSGTAKIVKQ